MSKKKLTRPEITKRIRVALGKTQPKMAEVLGMKRWENISNYENDKRDVNNERLLEYRYVAEKGIEDIEERDFLLAQIDTELNTAYSLS